MNMDITTDRRISMLNEQRSAKKYMPGGIWRRFAATTVDGIILALLQLPLTIPLYMLIVLAQPDKDETQTKALVTLLSYGVSFASIFIYYGWFYSRKGATPGKMLFGLRVVDENTGGHVSFWKAFGRETIGKSISTITFFIGYLLAGFREDGRALHDLMSGTRVLRSVR